MFDSWHTRVREEKKTHGYRGGRSGCLRPGRTERTGRDGRGDRSLFFDDLVRHLFAEGRTGVEGREEAIDVDCGEKSKKTTTTIK